MVGDPDAVPAGALESIAYLARSHNRVALLATLSTGAYTPSELHDSTGVARTTVGRIVNEFEERGWVERTSDGTYVTTPTGDQVAAEFTPLVESMAVVERLGDTVAWLQGVDPPLDLHHLREAVVRRPTTTDPMSPTAYYLDRLRTADEFHCLVGVAPPVSFETAMADAVADRGMTVEHVISGPEFAYVRDDPERASRWHEYIDAGANVYCYDDGVPCNLLVFDETVCIAKTQSEYGEPYTFVESRDDVVRSWAHEVIAGHKAAATRLTADAFSAGPDGDR
jgi:predicted transcriptional regulator